MSYHCGNIQDQWDSLDFCGLTGDWERPDCQDDGSRTLLAGNLVVRSWRESLGWDEVDFMVFEE